MHSLQLFSKTKTKTTKIKFKFLALTLLALSPFVTSLINIQPVFAAETLGYPHWDMPCEHSPYNSTGSCRNYDWGPVHTEALNDPSQYSSRGYTYRNCTDYVAWKLQSLGVADSLTRGLGNGGQWATNATGRGGVAVNTTPKAGAAAVAVGDPGHLAYVESVNADSTITISEYNHDLVGGGDRRTGAPTALGFSKFIDFGVSNYTGSGGNSPGAGAVGISYLGTDQLTSGQIMRAGQYILSNNVMYFLVLQGDGNLVLYGNNSRPIWASNTAGSGASFLAMQGDGNLVLYNSANQPVWHTMTNGRGPSNLRLQDDGNVVLYDQNQRATWNSQTGGNSVLNYYGSDILATNNILRTNQYLRSVDKRYALLLQGDGNLVLYGPGYHVLWNSQTSGRGVAFAAMQSDGNFVLYTSSTQPVWHTMTNGRGPSFAAMQSDGNFVIYTNSISPTWWTGTSGRI